MNLEIFKSSYGYYNLRTIDGRPTEEMVSYLKANGYRWSRNNNCWYPATNEAKEKNLNADFAVHFQEKFFPGDIQENKNRQIENQKTTMIEHLVDNATDYSLERNTIKSISEEIEKTVVNERTVQLEALIAELREELQKDKEKIASLENELANNRDERLANFYAQQEQQLIDEEIEWEKENSLTEEEEQKIIKFQEIIEAEAREEEPRAEKEFIKLQENTNEPLDVSPEELGVAKSVLPLAQYVSTLRFAQGEEGVFFKQKIKDIAKAVKNAPNIGETDGLSEHPIVLRYFHPTGTQTLVSEIGKDGEAFGFQCLNGDWEMAEWGDVDLNEIKGIFGMEVDYHIPDGMSVERYLYQEAPEAFPQYKELLNEKENGNTSQAQEKLTLKKTQEQFTSKKDIKKIREQCREILKKTDSEITEADRVILAQYEGAGGLNEENRTNAGILNEFYTPNNLVEKVWQIVDAYAPNAVTVLEPSAGVGKFANDRPDNTFTMHELDETSARINKILHPEANVIQGAYQKQFFDEDERFRKTDYEQPKYDVIIGNPPYGKYSDKYKGLGEGKEFDRYEEYFISKGLEALKDENSVMAFVVPSGFLNSNKDKIKKVIAEKGELIDAYRLPEGTFPTTEVGTDIIIMRSWEKKYREFQKLEEESQEKPEPFKENADKLLEAAKDDMAKVLSNNNFFDTYTEKILGEVKTRTNRFGRLEEYVAVHEGLTVQDELNKINGMLPSLEERNTVAVAAPLSPASAQADETSVYPEEKSIPEISSDSVSIKSSRPRKEKWSIAKSKGETMSAQEFSRLYGREFDEREFPIWRATDWQGNIELSKLTQDDLRYLSESGKYIEKNIGKWTHKVLFTSGDIYQKIEEQKQYLEKSGGNRLFEENIKLLESVKKPLVDMNHIHFGLRTTLAEEFTTTHIDSEGNTVELNLQESFILWAQNTSLANQKWRKDIDFTTANISREELGEEITFSDIVEYIDGTPVKAEALRGWRTCDMSEEEKKAEKAERKKEADLKRQIRSDIANKVFDRFLHEGLEKSDSTRLEAEYNRRFNSYIIPDYSKLPLFIDGMSAYKGDSKFKLYDQQIKGISFLCNKGNGLLAYDVGVGKTAAGIVATINQIQTERSTRPLIVVPNQVYGKWYTDIKQLFPNIKVNDLYNFNTESVGKYVDKANPHKLNIPANSISLCTYEALKNITFTDESCENALYEDFASLLSADFEGSERANAESSDKIKGIIGSASHVKDSSYYYFESCGFDNLTVDEAHNFKNLWVVPRPKNKGESNEYSGIPSGKPSARALKMYGMTQLVQRNNDNRNVFMLTATPFTNSPTEVYSMLSYIGRERLKELGLSTLRSFFDQFAQTKQELGVTSAGNIDTKQVMKNWKELPALQAILTEFIDKVDGEEAGIIRPNKFTHVKPLDMSELQKQMREIDEERMSEVKEGNSAAIIVAMNNMRLFCVAPALANPAMYPGIELPPLSQLVETSPKLKFVCDAVIDMYKDNPEKGQFMYVPLGKESHGLIKDYLVAHGIPKDAVEIINGEINNTPEKKEKITGKFNNEKDRLKIIIGGKNTSEGIDLNGNSFVMYNCSLGWNPSETIQAEGRIWRQGNLQGNVHIVYPVMNDSIDSVLYQKHDEKRSRINELWNYKGDALNVEDINPEDLKLDLIKDPQKKAKLILQEETKEVRAELSKLNLKIKSFDEIIEKKKQLSLDFNSAKERIEYQKNEIEAYKERGLEIPEWQKLTLKNCNKDFSKAENSLSKINEKFSSMNISTQEEQEEYIHRLNNQKHLCEDKIKHIKNTLPQVLEKLRIEQMEQKLVEYPVSKQREILEADILNNLRPMKEVEYEIKTMRYETMLAEKLKADDITQSEYDLYKNAGYEKYEQFMNGEIEVLEESREEQDRHMRDENPISDANPESKNKEETVSEQNTVSDSSISEPGKMSAGLESSDEKDIQMIKESLKYEGGLFFDVPESELFVHSLVNSNAVYSTEQNYFNFGNDDIYLTPEQLAKAEQKRDEIVFPVLNRNETGMYKAFKDFAEHGVFDIVGSKIDMSNEGKITETGFNQLHSAMNIYRSKEFETFRYILIDRKTGEINEQLAISSHMPNACKATLSDNLTLKQVISRAEETDSLVVAVHNHPSGNVLESAEDRQMTQTLEKSFTRTDGLNRFAGHIILDHDEFNLYTPKGGWNVKIDWERVGRSDELVNESFAFKDSRIMTTDQLADVAVKINDRNNWNDDFIPVVFANSDSRVTGLKLYDRSFFDKPEMDIRNALQSNGIEAGAVMAFPVITEAFQEKLNGSDRFLFEKRMKDLVTQNAFTDAVIVDEAKYVTTIVERYNVRPGLTFKNINSGREEVKATWETNVNQELFKRSETATDKTPHFKGENKKLKVASEIGY